MTKTSQRMNNNQKIRLGIACLLLVVVILAGCQGQSFIDFVFPSQEESLGELEESKESTEILIEESQPTPIPLKKIDLTIWMPQQFDISSDSEAAVMLEQRLQGFRENNPLINLNVRIKPASGPGSILETLAAASEVAPEALPSLILISRSDFVQAASKNLLFPVAGLTDFLDGKDWFDVARELAKYEGTSYCVPFAANALGLVYKQPEFNSDQPNWSEVVRQSDELIFSMGDPEALITIALYLSAGGALPEKSGGQELDLDALTTVFSAYALTAKNGRISTSGLDYQTDDQVWEAFLQSDRSSALTWTSRALSDSKRYKMAMLPSFGNEPLTLAGGWLWCLTDPNEQDRIHSLALAEYLSAPDFLTLWTPISGYLPVRPSAIGYYEGKPLQDTLLKIMISAEVRPDKTKISAFGSEITRGFSEIILKQNSPEETARNIITRMETMKSQ